MCSQEHAEENLRECLRFTEEWMMKVSEGENESSSSVALLEIYRPFFCIIFFSLWAGVSSQDWINTLHYGRIVHIWNEQHAVTGGLLADDAVARLCRDTYLQTVMRFFRSAPTLRADAFFGVRPIAIAVWMQPDSIQRRPRGLFGIRAQARSPPSTGPVSYKHPLSFAGTHWCCRRMDGTARPPHYQVRDVWIRNFRLELPK